MAMKIVLENLDGLSTEMASQYKKRDDGKYQLDAIKTDDLEIADVGKLQSAISKERENNRKSDEMKKAFDGIDPAKAREALKKVEEMASWTPEQKVKEQMEAVKAQMLDAHGKEKGKLEERLGRLNKQLEEAMIISVATQAITEHKGSVKLLMPHIKNQTRLREIDDKFVVEVIGADGNPRLIGSQGNPMSITELVGELKTQNDFASAFEGTGASGSGAKPGFNGGGTKIHTISAAESKDPARYRTAKAEAEKAGVQLQIADS